MAKEPPRVKRRTVTPLKLAIVASGLTTQQVADRIGVHASVVSRWANGAKNRIPKVNQAQAIARELDRTVDELWPAEEVEAA